MTSGNISKETVKNSALRFEMQLLAADFHEEWKRSNMVANYVAEYIAYQFPRRELAENLISTVVNEMLEAIVQLTPENGKIHLRISQETEGLKFTFSHNLQESKSKQYIYFLETLSKSLNDNLYLNLLVATDDTATDFNRLGLAMVTHDFNSLISFDPGKPGGLASTQVFLPTQELA